MRASRNRVLLVAAAMLWIAAYAAWTADWMVQPMPFLLERSIRRVPMCVFGFACCWAMVGLLDRLAGRPWSVRLPAALTLCAVSSVAYALLNSVVFDVIRPLWGPASLPDVFQLALTIAWVFIAWSALYFAVAADADARDVRLDLSDARAAEHRARNQALAQQISPHFLFNALNAVSGLILDGAPAKAERVTVALAELLRRSLESDAQDFVSFGEELDAVHRYLEIEEARFENRFRVIEQVPADLRKLSVPPMILQPLVENAIKHGVARSTELVTLTIGATRKDRQLEISIVDDASPDPLSTRAVGMGFGQKSVGERLMLLYGPLATFVCGKAPEAGYEVRLTLPLRASGHA